MKRIPILILIATGISLFSFSQNADTAAIKQLNRQFLDALVQEDSAAQARIFSDDVILINPGGKRRTKADMLSGLHIPGQKVTNIFIDSQEVRFLRDDISIITAWTTNFITQGEGKVVFKICYMDIYQRRNKQWKLKAAHVTLLN